MPAKPKTIASAEKRQIKAEISTRRKSLHKIQKDCVAEETRLSREIRKIEGRRKKLSKAYERESSAICRRISILQGRL
jgi:Skp family chaperone for outer membrane proteins